jgi:hypothetical protein
VKLTDPGGIGDRVGLPQEAVRRLQRRGFLRQLELDDAEMPERLLRGYIACVRGRSGRQRLEVAASPALEEAQTEP